MPQEESKNLTGFQLRETTRSGHASFGGLLARPLREINSSLDARNQMSGNQIKAFLERDIIEGRIAPGQRLDETSLSQRFNISRTPIREALRALANTGLIEIRPRRGAIVSKPNLKHLLEMFELMGELEGTCGKLAAHRMSADERQILLFTHRKSSQAAKDGNHEAYNAADAELHEAIYRGCHNNFLAEQTRLLRNRLAPYRSLQLRRPDRLQESFDEHGEIVKAISSGAAELAASLLRKHATSQGGSYYDLVAMLQPGRALSGSGQAERVS